MAKVIYEKHGIRIEEFDCGKEGTCYELNLVGEDKLGYFDGEKRKRFRKEEMQGLVADLVELRIGKEKSGKSENKVKLIRRRESYKRFIAFAEELRTTIELTSKQVEILLDIYYNTMNDAHAYGSIRNADLAYESLQQVKEDLRKGDLK